MSILKKYFGYGSERLKVLLRPAVAVGGTVAGRISLPPAADLKKQGQSGSDAGAPREVQYLCMRERGKPADEPESPPPFSNEIRTAMNNERR